MIRRCMYNHNNSNRNNANNSSNSSNSNNNDKKKKENDNNNNNNNKDSSSRASRSPRGGPQRPATYIHISTHIILYTFKDGQTYPKRFLPEPFEAY